VLRLILIAGLGMVTFTGWSQPGIRGTVRDPSRNPLPFCNVFVQRNGVLARLTATDTTGRFSLDHLDSGRYQLSVTSLGFRKYDEAILLSNQTRNIEITLIPDTVILDQVIVHGPGPIQVKGDTIIYDAVRFSKGDEVSIADLLKKMPGLSVDDNGKVRFQGKEVKKIKVEDDDLFEDQYQILTKNLSADLVEQVEVLQNYSDNRLLKNIEDSEDVALNLKLKKDRKQSLFGDVRAQTNFYNRYETNANLISISTHLKAYGLLSANNTGSDPTGNLDPSLETVTAQRVPGSEVSSQYLVPVDKPAIAQFKRDRYYFNDALLGSLNMIYRPTKKFKLSIQGYNLSEETDFTLLNKREYFTPADTIAFNEAAVSNNNDNHRLFRVSAEGDPSADFNIRFNARYQTHSGETGQQSNLNQNAVAEILDSKMQRADQLLTITRLLSPQTSVTLDLRYLTDNRPQDYRVQGNLLNDYFLPAPASDTLTQSSDMPTRFWGGEVNLYRRAKTGKIGVRFGYENLQQKISSSLLSTQAALSGNNISSNQYKTYTEGYFAWKVGRVILTPSAAVQLVNFKLSDRSTEPMVFINPRLGLRWQISERSRLTAVYTAGRNTSSLSQLTKSPMLQDYNLLAINDSSFRKFDSRTIFAGYELADWLSGFNLFVNFFHRETPGDYLANTDIESNFTITTQNQLADRSFSSLTFNLDKFLKGLRSNLKFRWSFTRLNFITSTESVRASTEARGHSLETSLRTGLPGPFNLHLGSIVDIASSRSSLIEATNVNSLVYLDVYYVTLQRRLSITLHTERYQLSSVSGQPVFHFIDLSARFSLTPAQRFTLLLKGRNLLNENIFRQRFVSYQAITTSANQLIPRYILFGVEFRF